MRNVQRMRDKLTGELIGLARATDGNEHLISESSTAVIVEALCATQSDGNYDAEALETLLERVEQEKRKMVPDCFLCASPCGKNNAYDMEELQKDDEDIRQMKQLLLQGIREMAKPGHRDRERDGFFYKALIAIGMDGWTADRLQPIVLELGDKK